LSYVNDELEISAVHYLKYSAVDGRVTDDTGTFSFKPEDRTDASLSLYTLAKHAGIMWSGDAPGVLEGSSNENLRSSSTPCRPKGPRGKRREARANSDEVQSGQAAAQIEHVSVTGDRLVIDVRKMRQLNCRTGLQQPVSRKRNQGQWKWLYDAREKLKEKAKWATYPAEVCEKLERAYHEQLGGDSAGTHVHDSASTGLVGSAEMSSKFETPAESCGAENPESLLPEGSVHEQLGTSSKSDESKGPRCKRKERANSDELQSPEVVTHVEHVTVSGDRCVIDVGKMRQLNCRTGLQQPVCRKRNQGQWKWQYGTREKNGAQEKTKEKTKWATYPAEVCEKLERAYHEHLGAHYGFHDGASTGSMGPSEMSGKVEISEPVRKESSDSLFEAPSPESLNETLEYLEAAQPKTLSPEEGASVRSVALSTGADPRIAFRTLRMLVRRHGIRCTLDDVRRAALLLGSMAMLQLVLSSDPSLQLVGMHIFDRRYPGQFKLNEEGRKRCLKALLARGALLGPSNYVPTSKLLRKIEADAFALWSHRYLDSVAAAGFPELPDHARHAIGQFLGLQSLDE